MKTFKVMTIVGTRPEIIRLSRVIDKLDKNVIHILVHTGQNYDYELNKIFFDDLGIRSPNHYLDAANGTSSETIANIISKIDKIIEIENPNAVLILGDTNSSLSAIAAKKRKIPIFHMEAGNRCFDERVPEEINRKIVDHISDINLPYSEISRECLLREGLPADRIIKTGSPMREVLEYYKDKISSSKVLSALSLEVGKYFVVSCHREENVDSPIQLVRLASTLNAISNEYGLKIIFTTHPRTRKRLDEAKIKLKSKIVSIKPLGFTDYISLQMGSLAVISDSGTISEESSILNIPAINIRETHERHEAMEEAVVVFTGLKAENVLRGLSITLSQHRDNKFERSNVRDYESLNVSDKILRIIISYTDYVNRLVWKK